MKHPQLLFALACIGCVVPLASAIPMNGDPHRVQSQPQTTSSAQQPHIPTSSSSSGYGTFRNNQGQPVTRTAAHRHPSNNMNPTRDNYPNQDISDPQLLPEDEGDLFSEALRQDDFPAPSRNYLGSFDSIRSYFSGNPPTRSTTSQDARWAQQHDIEANPQSVSSSNRFYNDGRGPSSGRTQ